MYIDHLRLENIRTFAEPTSLEFIHPDGKFRPRGAGLTKDDSRLPKPRLPNVTLLLGNNGSGKTTVLQAVALTAFGPAVEDANLRVRRLVRFAQTEAKNGLFTESVGRARAKLWLHEQDGTGEQSIESPLSVFGRGELESIEFDKTFQPSIWKPVYSSDNPAFFVVGYGATRRVEAAENFDMGARTKNSFIRAQRVEGLFRDSYSLIPLTYWLPKLEKSEPDRHAEVVELINRLLKQSDFKFTAQFDKRTSDYVFERGGMRIPFQSLSDGYRAFLGWVADLLYHLNFACPAHEKLVNTRGIVLVDEIDLHLHPKWQIKVVETLSKALPRMQFIFTSHSPLVAGSLEWMNIITLRARSANNKTTAKRLKQSIHGLDADQILLTSFFGLKSTVAPAKQKQLEDITERIRSGDKDAPLQLIREMSSGTEAEE